MAPDLAAAHPRSSDQLPPTLLEQPRTLRRATPLQQHSPNPRKAFSHVRLSSTCTSLSKTIEHHLELPKNSIEHHLELNTHPTLSNCLLSGSVVSLTRQAPPPRTASFLAGPPLLGVSPPSPPIGRADTPPARLSDRSGIFYIRRKPCSLCSLHPTGEKLSKSSSSVFGGNSRR